MTRWTAARASVLLILTFGMYLHLSRLVFGTDAVQDRLLTPAVDSVFAGVLVATTVAVVAARRRVRLRGRLDAVLFYGTLAYVAASVPLHARTWFVPENVDVFRRFPWWYSLLFLGVSAVLVIGWTRLRGHPAPARPDR